MKHDVKTVKIYGGLGNQMFQYAFALALQKRTGCRVQLDISTYANTAGPGKNGVNTVHNGFELEQVFSLPPCSFAPVTKDSKVSKVLKRLGLPRSRFLDRQFTFQPEVFTNSRYTWFEGYWQNEQYFIDVKDEILRQYQFRGQVSEKTAAVAARIAGKPSLSIHVRHGDYASVANYPVCQLSYYRDAVAQVRKERPFEQVYIFSDDLDWCRGNLAPLFTDTESIAFVDWNRGKDSWQDVYLMSACHSHIIANSSFSWWAAWLDGKEDPYVVAPKVWALPLSGFYHFTYDEVVPPTWHRL